MKAVALARLRSALQRRGVDLIRYPAGTVDGRSFVIVAQRLGVDVAVDIGANRGQYARLIRARGFDGRIVSFEPVQATFDRLTAESASDPLWEAHRYALGSTAERRPITVPALSEGSSFQAPSPLANRLGGYGGYQEEVEVVRLDGIFDELVGGERAMLKIDTQGWDLAVVQGAESVLDRIVAAQLELPIRSFYVDVPDLTESLVEMGELGFAPLSVEPIVWVDDLVAYVDCLFVRTGSLTSDQQAWIAGGSR
jgi:FkbM family methyltransferase